MFLEEGRSLPEGIWDRSRSYRLHSYFRALCRQGKSTIVHICLHTQSGKVPRIYMCRWQVQPMPAWLQRAGAVSRSKGAPLLAKANTDGICILWARSDHELHLLLPQDAPQISANINAQLHNGAYQLPVAALGSYLGSYHFHVATLGSSLET